MGNLFSSDAAAAHGSSYAATVDSIQNIMAIDSAMVNKLKSHMKVQMKEGLEKEGQTINMIPTYVGRVPTGNEKGEFLAVDVGGSNFRVVKATLPGNGVSNIEMKESKEPISEEIKTGTGEAMFDYLAEGIKKFVPEACEEGPTMPLGVTFSFPIDQTSIDSGTLNRWTKGFSATGVVGNDVCQLLNEALVRKGVKRVKVAALINDTTGTLASGGAGNPSCYIGLILGTGTNAAYVEETKKITKLSSQQIAGEKDMLINTEWGAFDQERKVLPITKYDNALDMRSPNPGQQIFEKMISGKYLGEIARLVMEDLIFQKRIFTNMKSIPEIFAKADAFETKYMSGVCTPGQDLKAYFQTELKIFDSTAVDRDLTRRVCDMIAVRAARLASAGLCAIMESIGKTEKCTIAVDGSLYTLFPGFKEKMEAVFREEYPGKEIHTVPSVDGSGKGAALIAAAIQ